MKKKSAVLLAALAATLCFASPVRASDHTDGPQASKNPAADITDFYSWMSADGSKLYMVMDVFPFATTSAQFDPTILYMFHTRSYVAYGGASGDAIRVLCNFDASQNITCWLTDTDNNNNVTTIDYATGNPSDPTKPVTGVTGKIKKIYA